HRPPAGRDGGGCCVMCSALTSTLVVSAAAPCVGSRLPPSRRTSLVCLPSTGSPHGRLPGRALRSRSDSSRCRSIEARRQARAEAPGGALPRHLGADLRAGFHTAHRSAPAGRENPPRSLLPAG